MFIKTNQQIKQITRIISFFCQQIKQIIRIFISHNEFVQFVKFVVLNNRHPFISFNLSLNDLRSAKFKTASQI